MTEKLKIQLANIDKAESRGLMTAAEARDERALARAVDASDARRAWLYEPEDTR